MNKFYLFIFIIFLGCSNSHRVYICGDHPCKNKKEINDYFKNNISIEVYVVESERGNRDLVEMNLIKEKGVENRKDKAVTILWTENFSDGRWEIFKSNSDYKRLDAFKALFIVKLSANSKEEINFTARMEKN